VPDKTLLDAYNCLELEPTADRQAVEKSYRRMKALYDEETLAIYGLFDEDERIRMLEEIELAYHRINTIKDEDQESQESCPSPFSPSIPHLDEATTPAAYLRRIRESRGISLQEIAEQTNIGTRHLTMIEEERYEALPAPVYLRGFVFDYARTIGVPDPSEVARRYLERCLEVNRQM